MPLYGVPVDKDLILESWLACNHCGKTKKAAPLAKLKYREIANAPMEELHLDHIIKENVNKSTAGHNAAVTIKCQLTRYFACYPVKSTRVQPAIDILQGFFMATGRIPKKIYADNAFDTNKMHDFCKKNSIQISFRPSSLSRSNSVESTHRALHRKIESFLESNKSSLWHEVAWKAAHALNCQPHSVTGFTPYYLFHGHHPVELVRGFSDIDESGDKYWLTDLKIAKINSDTQRLKISSNFDFPKFQKGQKIRIKLDNSKNAGFYEGEIIQDDGGSSALVKLENRKRPILYHKGHIHAVKHSDAWKILYKTDRKFDSEDKAITPVEIADPISSRTRSKDRNLIGALSYLIHSLSSIQN